MKKFLILVFLLLLTWPFYKNYLPSFFRIHNISNSISAIVYPWEDFVFKEFRRIDKPKYWHRIIDVNYSVISKTLKSLERNQNEAVIFFYNSSCLKCRFMLNEINQLAHDFEDVKFFVVAFQENKKQLSALLNNFEELYFKPIRSSEGDFAPVKILFSRDDIKIKGFPAIIYADYKSDIIKQLNSGLYVRNNILRAMEK